MGGKRKKGSLLNVQKSYTPSHAHGAVVAVVRIAIVNDPNELVLSYSVTYSNVLLLVLLHSQLSTKRSPSLVDDGSDSQSSFVHQSKIVDTPLLLTVKACYVASSWKYC